MVRPLSLTSFFPGAILIYWALSFLLLSLIFPTVNWGWFMAIILQKGTSGKITFHNNGWTLLEFIAFITLFMLLLFQEKITFGLAIIETTWWWRHNKGGHAGGWVSCVRFSLLCLGRICARSTTFTDSHFSKPVKKWCIWQNLLISFSCRQCWFSWFLSLFFTFHFGTKYQNDEPFSILINFI